MTKKRERGLSGLSSAFSLGPLPSIGEALRKDIERERERDRMGDRETGMDTYFIQVDI